jgi:hypothetical protein
MTHLQSYFKSLFGVSTFSGEDHLAEASLPGNIPRARTIYGNLEIKKECGWLASALS